MGAQEVNGRVAIREVGMRDGLQSIAEIMPTETKMAWLDAEYAAGVREIEVTSFVPPKLLPQLVDAEAIVRHALTLPGLTVSALIPNSRGAERGLALGVHEMNFVLSVSEGHNRANVRRSTDDSIADFRRVVQLCREQGGENRPRINCGLATAFGCTIEGDVDEDRVRRIANEAVEAGADGILLADTVGYGQPAAIGRVFRKIIADVAPLPVCAHFHDTRGLGLANVVAAYEAGCRGFDASLGGLGGCPYAPGATGNIVLEDTVFLFEAMGVSTGIDIERLGPVRELVGLALPGVAMHGAIARAGLPRNFRPATSEPSPCPLPRPREGGVGVAA
jgi:hydroxymethylglutaryl-CoA lyase